MTDTLSKRIDGACRERQIKLNKRNFTFTSDDVQFIGHRVAKHWLKTDPPRMEASSI